MKKRFAFFAVIGLILAAIRWKRSEITALLGGPQTDTSSAPVSSGASMAPTKPATPPPAAETRLQPEATRPSDEGDAARTTLAAKNFPTGAAATEEVAVDSEDSIPDRPRDEAGSQSTPTVNHSSNGSSGSGASKVSGPESDPGNWVRGDGSAHCPDDYPIKGNGNSRIYHTPGEPSYEATIPELCFASEDAAAAKMFRPTKRHQQETS